MIEYSKKPFASVNQGEVMIPSFVNDAEQNIDWKTVQSFGDEWTKFNSFSEEEIQEIGDDYFDLLNNLNVYTDQTVALDVGCGVGRWAKYLSPKVKFIEAIDPSNSVFSAHYFLKEKKNIRITQAGVDSIPFPDQSFDIIYSLGVLHHVPNTEEAIKNCYSKLKPGGYFLIYLYYALDNRSVIYKTIFRLSNVFRQLISNLPKGLKHGVCDFIALIIYFPVSRFALLIEKWRPKMAQKIPLFYYRNLSLSILRNDALDRFGTPLEKRFTKVEIQEMLEKAKFTRIVFSTKAPFWHAIAQK